VEGIQRRLSKCFIVEVISFNNTTSISISCKKLENPLPDIITTDFRSWEAMLEAAKEEYLKRKNEKRP